MSINWTTKEKLVLLSDILEYGEQPESWLNISNDLLRIFQNNPQSTQIKLENRYSIKVCFKEKISFLFFFRFFSSSNRFVLI